MSALPATPLPGFEPWSALATLTPADADRFRIVVTPDDDPQGPLEWGDVTVVRSSTDRRAWSDGTPTGGTDPIRLADALESFSERLPDTDAITAAAIRWARVFHGVEVQRWDVSLSQSTWVDALVYLEGEAAKAAADDQRQSLGAYVDDLTAWGRGEVYGVRLERDTASDRWEGSAWEGVDDCEVWGCYLGNAYTAADVAVDNFGTPRAFAEAVAVVYAWDIR